MRRMVFLAVDNLVVFTISEIWSDSDKRGGLWWKGPY